MLMSLRKPFVGPPSPSGLPQLLRHAAPCDTFSTVRSDMGLHMTGAYIGELAMPLLLQSGGQRPMHGATSVHQSTNRIYGVMCAELSSPMSACMLRIFVPHKGNGSQRMQEKRRSLPTGFSLLGPSPLHSRPSPIAARRTSSNGSPRGGMIFLPLLLLRSRGNC